MAFTVSLLVNLYVWALNYISFTFNLFLAWKYFEKTEMRRFIWFFNILFYSFIFHFKISF